MKKRGIGYATIFYGTGYGNGFPDESRATVELLKDGTFKVFVEVSDVGSGGLSVMWQIAAETLKVPKELVKIISSNTSLMKDSGTAAASRQTYNTGNAVYDGAKKLRGAMEEGGSFENTVEAYENMVKGELPTRAEGYFKADTTTLDMETGQGNPYWPYTFGGQKVTVEVDEDTGKVDVLEVVAVNDMGRVINPVTAEGQVHGGISMGLGYALMEEVDTVKGAIKNTNFSSYIIPTSKDMPKMESYFVEAVEESGPYGAKGAGEPVMIPTAPAILNAIYDAVGIRVTSLPVTCDKLLLLLDEKKKSKVEIVYEESISLSK